MRPAAILLTLAASVAAATAAGPDSDTLEGGRYLTRAADCFACHTADTGAPYSGGRPIKTPFGTIYSTNITPHPEAGIGDWSAEAFYDALHGGELPDGTQLYPAMPYTSYHLLTREDTDAMFAYLQTLEPVDRSAPENDLGFPFNQRWGLNLWNLFYKGDDEFQPDPQRSDEYNRGEYLATALGHCAECHTPRNIAGALDEDRHFAGSELGYIRPPAITPQALVERGWSKAALREYLRNGLSRLGAANGEMFPAVIHSTHYLTDSDMDALIHYLAGGEAFDWPAQSQTVATADHRAEHEGRPTYLEVCAACHAADGEGIPHTAVPLAGNVTVRLDDPHNLIAVILDGLPAQDFPGFDAMAAMPGFADTLTDQQIADLANYVRVTWGGLPGDVTAEQVRAVPASRH